MRKKIRLRPATKIGIAAAIGIVALFAGYRGYNVWRVGGMKFEAIEPSEVNIVGVDPGAGYYIVVANNMAQLVRGANTGSAHEENYDPESTSADDSEKKRVPMRELLESLQGNIKSLGRFVMVMNDLNEEELPPDPALWKAEDLKKALDGDQALLKKLEKDLNVKLDGTPLDAMTVKAVEEGIVIDTPVTVKVQVGHELQSLTARVQESFVPRFIQNLQRRYQDSKNYTVQTIVGFYGAMAKDVLDGKSKKEDVRTALESHISEHRQKMLAERPERILSSARVIVNENQIKKASMTERELSDGRKVYDIDLDLTDEGRDRLWQFSLNRIGAQILFVWNGSAIAAPRVQHELSQSTVTIKGVGDYRLAKGTVDALNKLSEGGK